MQGPGAARGVGWTLAALAAALELQLRLLHHAFEVGAAASRCELLAAPRHRLRVLALYHAPHHGRYLRR